MTKQTMTQAELDAIIADMDECDDDDYEFEIEDDGQPDEYTEWQDFMGGDDWDQGQYDNDCDCMYDC